MARRVGLTTIHFDLPTQYNRHNLVVDIKHEVRMSETGEPQPNQPVPITDAEYNALRAEILSELSSKNSVLTFGLAAIGAIIALGGLQNTERPTFLLAVPFVSLIVVILYVAVSDRVSEIGTYIAEKCWTRVLALSEPVYAASWEENRRPTKGTSWTGNFSVSGLFDIGIYVMFFATSVWCVLLSRVSGGYVAVGICASLAVAIIPSCVAWSIARRARQANSQTNT
jgi:hypothetical protein